VRIRIRAAEIKRAKALRVHVARRIGFALSRFGDRIESVEVHFSESAGVHSATDRRCRLQLTLRLARTVSVEDTDADAFVAADRAVDRAARTISRILEVESGLRVLPLPPPPPLVAPRRRRR